jgi:tRNA pseudouridine55 synthase
MSVENSSGILLIDKPAGMTSHDVVNYIRRKLDTKRVGHTGTLDPSATGLLVTLLGRGTLLSSWLIGMSKRYFARFVFGLSTDTYDGDGEVTSTVNPGQISLETFEKLLQKFNGEIEQVIPPYSAAKRNGKTLHKMARIGKEFNPGIKVVEISKIEVVDFSWPEVVLDIRCSTGTYIRSLAHQMGCDLGCGGYLKALRRSEVGPFRVASAQTLEDFMRSSQPENNILPLRQALPEYPILHIKELYRGAVLGGRPLQKRYFAEGNYSGSEGELSLLLDTENNVLALVRLNMSGRSFDNLSPSQVMGSYVRVIDEADIRVK